MTEDSSSHRPTKRIHVYSETSRRADLEFVCIIGHDGRWAFEYFDQTKKVLPSQRLLKQFENDWSAPQGFR